jgi:hypothetical protein
MSVAEKIDYKLIPVIDVAHALLGQETRERTTANERHFDGHGGLFVNIKKNRWYSHGNQAGGDAVGLIRFALGCDYKAAFDWLRSNGYESFLGERPSPKRPVKEYDYTDESGARLYQTVRFEPKDFRQRRSDGNGGWIWKGPERPVPYKLPELIASGDAPVLIAGGEKDVDNLRALGFTATTNHGGEGKWWPELTPYLKDRRVFILCDNDEQGEKHQAAVGAALNGVASEIRVVRFPELPAKGDVSDWIALREKEGLNGKAIYRKLAEPFRDEATAWEPTPCAVSAVRCQNGISAPIGTIGTELEGAKPDLSILSHDRLSPPRLPLEAFGNYWSKWIGEQAEAKSCPPDYVAGGLIGGAGVLIRNARWGSPWAGWEEPPNVWINNVGYPSSGKSPGFDAVRDLLTAIEADDNADHKENVDAWDTQKREAKIRLDVWESACKAALKDSIGVMPPKPENTEEPPRPTRKRIITNDPTVEKVARLVLENPKGMMLFRDELAGGIGALDKYGGAGGDRAFYLESYSGRAYAVDRMRDPEPIVVPSLTLSITGGIQPDRLATLVLSGDDDGLAARFLYLWPERTPPQRPKNTVPVGARAKLTSLYELKDSRDDFGNRNPLRFDEKAAEALQDYRKQVAAAETDASGLYLSWLGKLPGMAVRLAVIFEHLHWCGDNEGEAPPNSISERATVAAIAFLDRYAAPMARRCFGEAALPQVDIDARALARWIKEHSPSTINARDLRRAGALSTKDAARYDAAIAELESGGWLRP